MIFDMDKGVARAKFAVGGKKHDDGNDDGTDDGASNADDVSSMKHSGSASSMAGIKAVKSESGNVVFITVSHSVFFPSNGFYLCLYRLFKQLPGI